MSDDGNTTPLSSQEVALLKIHADCSPDSCRVSVPRVCEDVDTYQRSWLRLIATIEQRDATIAALTERLREASREL